MKKAVLSVLFSLIACACAYAQAQIKPGDVLILDCVEEPKLGGEYNVTEQGLILMQFIGAVEVKGLTVAQAAEKVSRTLTTQQILKTATITIRIKESEPKTISVSGAVRAVAPVAYTDGMTLGEVLKAADPTESTNLAAVRITRGTSDNFTVNATTVEGAAFAVFAGDRVFVPVQVAKAEVTVLGAVARPGIVPYTEGMTLSGAISAAGGFRSDADKKRVEVRAASGSRVVDTESGGGDVAIDRGDVVVVGLIPITEKVYVTGAVSRPGLIPFEPGLTVSRAVEDAQPLEGARTDRVRINRKEIDKRPSSIQVNLKKVRAGTAPDVELRAGDTIEVPYPSSASRGSDTIKYAGIGLLLFFLFRR